MARDDLIERLYEIRYDKPFIEASSHAIEEFRSELLDCHSHLTREGRSTVSPTAIRNWVGTGGRRSIPKRLDALIFIDRYLQWLKALRGVQHGNQDENTVELKTYLSSLIGVPRLRPEVEAEFSREGRNFFIEDPTVEAAVRTIVHTSSRNSHSERNDLFRASRQDQSDLSFYVLYRYSTSGSNIVKSFMIINTPELGSDTFSYRHIIWCRPPEASRGARSRINIFRECEGVIAKFPTSYYFVGYNFTVPINRITNPQGYIASREKNRTSPQGLDLLVVEYESIRRSPGLFSALTMTFSNER